MKKQYFSTQDIFNKVLAAGGNALKASLGQHSAQDVINAVFSPEAEALRISLAGGMLPAVASADDLPATADLDAICPVVTPAGDMFFYKWNGAKWDCLNAGAGGGGTDLPAAQKAALVWLTENLDRLKEVLNTPLIKEMVLELHGGEEPYAVVQGTDTRLEIADTGDTDGDAETLYRLDLAGYLLDIETYAPGAAIPDRYYTKIVYEAAAGAGGISRIYLEEGEFAEFAGRTAPYNTIRAHYMTGLFGGAAVERVAIAFPAQGAEQVGDDLTPLPDTGDTDGDAGTLWRVEIPGYVLNLECYPGAEAALPARFAAKLHYNAGNNTTALYMTAEMYSELSGYPAGKNIVFAYRFAE